MIQGLKVTLFELFGYALPGAVATVGLSVFAWSVLWPDHPFTLASIASAHWIALVVVSYIAGHVLQAIANLLAKRTSPEADLLNSEARLLATEARARMGRIVSADLDTLPADQLLTLLDASLVARGLLEDRDVFVYRSGFYRGGAVALGLFGLASAVRALVPGTIIGASANLALPPSLVGAGAALSLVSAWLFWKRWKRFARYRALNALSLFLTDTQPTVSKATSTTGGDGGHNLVS